MTGERGLEAGHERDRPTAPDRAGLPTWMVPSLVAAAGSGLAVAGQATVGNRGGPEGVGLVAGVLVAALAILGLRSLSIRLVSRLLVVTGGALLVRFGAFSGSLVVGSQGVLVWVLAAVAVFVLTDRIATGAQPGLVPTDGDGPPAAAPPAGALRSPGGRPAAASTLRSLVVVSVAVVLFAVLLTPFALPLVAESSSPGQGPRLDRGDTAGASLRSTDSLDMTQRPDLTDEVMFTVTTDRATFWRGETFDQWDGRRWSRSENGRMVIPPTGDLISSPDDLGSAGPDAFDQTFRIEADYSDVIFAAPSAVSVDARGTLAQRADGTVTTVSTALGRGATYQVSSRRPVLSAERLRAVDGGEVPAAIREQYAAAPVTTDRVRQAASRVTAGASTTYDKVLALQEWMGSRTEYSLDAPLSPEGVDVVDHFLFESRQGWCEQVASSLVVLARANGIPTRLVTGFVPEDRDRVTGSYIVRARDAHAWAEVWFPELGWVPFDPTADVPLAGSVQTEPTWSEWLADHALYLALGLALVVAIAGPAYVLLRRWAAARRHRPVGWLAAADARLGAIGERAGRPRAPSETARSYARVLAVRYRDPRVVVVGEALDDALYAPDPVGPDRRARVEQVLAELEAADVPDAEVPVAEPPDTGPHPEPVGPGSSRLQ